MEKQRRQEDIRAGLQQCVPTPSRPLSPSSNARF